MLAYHDASGGLADNRKNDGLSYGNQNRPARELDELETSKTQQCLKKTTKFLFSHIGLVGLVVIYAVAGGFLFQLLEGHQEKLNCQEYQGEQFVQITKLKQNIINYVKNNATPKVMSSVFEKDNTTVAYTKIGSMLFQYREFVIKTSSKYRSYDDNCSIVNKWTYGNSLLFAITIMTTIGYGITTPMTWEGQLCCVCYATIGIPIFLLCIANISGVLGEMFRFIYSKIICGPCKFIKKRRAQARKDKFEEENGISTDLTRRSGWTLNDDNKKSPEKRLSNSMGNDNEMVEEALQRNQRVAVPLTVTMIIIAVYIWVGSALFHNFEGWTMTQSGYFCFITLATIGFGDFVPGQRKDDPNANTKLILGAVYVLFGMAILAMCFDLMQEEIVAKFRWMGTKIGIIEKRNANNDETDNTSDTKNKRDSATHDPYSSRNTSRTLIDDGNGIQSPTQRNSSATRKLSPRNNIARVHPMGINPSDEATLHQRVGGTKPY